MNIVQTLPLIFLSIFPGVDLISGVSCDAPYEWVDKTNLEWDFNSNERDGETFRVSIVHSKFVLIPENCLQCGIQSQFILYCIYT